MTRTWSWVATEAEVRERRLLAARLVGRRVTAAHYYVLDQRREELLPDLLGTGPRIVDDDAEWAAPTWREAGFDAVDFGIELSTDAGTTFSLTWDSPGDHEGVGLRAVPLLGNGVSREADVAIWPVTKRTTDWVRLACAPLAGVELHYSRWASGGFWCPHVAFHTEDASLHVVLGDTRDGVLGYSSDNLAVLHEGTTLPAWAG